MSTLIIASLLVGVAYLVVFHRPQNFTQSRLVKWFSEKLSEISESLEQDIQSDKQGQYIHRGKQGFESQGSITYILLDKSHKRFDVSDRS